MYCSKSIPKTVIFSIIVFREWVYPPFIFSWIKTNKYHQYVDYSLSVNGSKGKCMSPDCICILPPDYCLWHRNTIGISSWETSYYLNNSVSIKRKGEYPFDFTFYFEFLEKHFSWMTVLFLWQGNDTFEIWCVLRSGYTAKYIANWNPHLWYLLKACEKDSI